MPIKSRHDEREIVSTEGQSLPRVRIRYLFLKFLSKLVQNIHSIANEENHPSHSYEKSSNAQKRGLIRRINTSENLSPLLQPIDPRLISDGTIATVGRFSIIR